MSDSNSGNSSSLITAAATLGGFAIFAIIVAIAYLPQRAEPLPEGSRTPKEREDILSEVRNNAAKINHYGWVDKSAGVAHIPVDRAIELTLKELNAGK